MSMFISVFTDSLADCVKLLPFLFLTYLAMEYLEHKAGNRTVQMIRKAGKAGPIAGGVLGIFPQCGFSAAASSLYAGRLITVGTLLAVFLSTSDEMLPILISQQAEAGLIMKILFMKMLFGVVTGLAADFILRHFFKHREKEADIHHLCEHEHCHCDEKHVVRSALHHTLHILIYLFLITLVLNLIVSCLGEEALSSFIINAPVLGQILAGLVGLIPNCAASVVITDLYLEGVLNGGAMMTGLLVSAGVGLLVLFRTYDNLKKNIQIVVLLYASGVFWGLLVQLTGIL